MEKGICLISVAPLRLSADDRSEMVTQLLFGDQVEILQRKDKWLMVALLDDGYQGWVSAGQIAPLSQENSELLHHSNRFVSTDLVQLLEDKSLNTSFLVSAGSSFYNCHEGAFELAGKQFHFHGNCRAIAQPDPSLIPSLALNFLNTPYLWGGKSALGIDCSGFTQLVYKMAGFQILRDASQQATQGQMLNLIHEAAPGDLLFFDNEEQAIIHVGILLDDEHIIHAHQTVRVDKIDHQGIFNTSLRKYTHKLRFIKRMYAVD
ncbi:MAG: NlpC/P60 family protein [Bacteroidales bacterium]